MTGRLVSKPKGKKSFAYVTESTVIVTKTFKRREHHLESQCVDAVSWIEGAPQDEANVVARMFIKINTNGPIV